MKNIFILLGIVLLVLDCTNDKPLPNGYDLLERDNKAGLMEPVTLTPTHYARYWEAPTAGRQSSLLLGESQNVQSSILFKCRNLIKIDTTEILLSTTLKLFGSHLFGEDSLMSVSLHRVDSDWTENSVLYDDMIGGYAADALETVDFTFHKNDWTDIPVTNLDFMREWIVDSYQSEQTINGVLIKVKNATNAAEFVSADATENPAYIEVVTQNSEGENDTTKAYFSHDASLLKFETDDAPEQLQEIPQTLRIGNASGYHSFIKFDVSAIPAEATIHRALLKFYVDGDGSKTKDDASMSISAARLTSDSLWLPTAVAVDSMTLPATDLAGAENEVFAFDSSSPVNILSRIVQKWVSDDNSTDSTPNYGFLLMPYRPGVDFQELSLMTGAVDSVFMPTLEIIYSLPPSHRFAN